MPPSRGIIHPGLTLNNLRASWQGIGLGPRPLARGPKNFSTISRAPKTLNTLLRRGTIPSQWQRVQLPARSLPSASLGLRFNSTGPSQTPTTTSPSQAHPESGGSFEQVNLDELADLVKTNISAVPEHIGYLRELGIEYNWGARATIEWTLEHIHVLAGTPWWLSIVLTAVLFRLVCFPLTLRMSDSAARLGAMGPAVQGVREKMTRARLTQDNNLNQEALIEMGQVYRNAGTSPLKMLLPALAPMWIGISSFNLLRSMTSIPVPGLLSGGLLWVQDLTQADPFCVIPLASSILMYFALKAGGEAGVQTSSAFSPQTMKTIRIVFPFVAFAAVNWLPAAMQLTILTATIWGIIQAYLLRNPRSRELLGLYPLIKQTPSSAKGKLQPRVTITPTEVRSGVQSVTNPMENYQAPQEQKKTILQGAQKEVKGMFSEMKQSLWRNSRGMVGSNASNEEQQPARGKRSREFTKQAAAYEKAHASWAGKQTKDTRK